MNRIAEEGEQRATPAVADGATIYFYTDRKAATVTSVESPTHVTIQYDKAIRTDENGMSECQSYRYEPNPQGMFVEVKLGRDGVWRTPGGKHSGNVVRFGIRHAYHDYSF